MKQIYGAVNTLDSIGRITGEYEDNDIAMLLGRHFGYCGTDWQFAGSIGSEEGNIYIDDQHIFFGENALNLALHYYATLSSKDKLTTQCEHKNASTTALGAITNLGWTCKDCGQLLPGQQPAPGQNKIPPTRVVVCAAIRVPVETEHDQDSTTLIITGPHHFDSTMLAVIHRLDANLNTVWLCMEQGFIDQHGVFMDRKEALRVACEADQLSMDRLKGHPLDELFSEDLY